MAAINIVLIGRVDDNFSIWCQLDVFNLEVPRRKERSSSTFGRDRVKMVISVLFGSEDEATAGRKLEGDVSRKLRETIVGVIPAPPNDLGGCRLWIGYKDGPRYGSLWDEGLIPFDAWNAEECDLIAIRRPTGRTVSIDTRG